MELFLYPLRSKELFSRSNIIDTHDKNYLINCRYNRSDPVDRLCPVIELETIINGADEVYNDIAIQVHVYSTIIIVDAIRQ